MPARERVGDLVRALLTASGIGFVLRRFGAARVLIAEWSASKESAAVWLAWLAFEVPAALLLLFSHAGLRAPLQLAMRVAPLAACAAVLLAATAEVIDAVVHAVASGLWLKGALRCGAVFAAAAATLRCAARRMGAPRIAAAADRLESLAHAPYWLAAALLCAVAVANALLSASPKVHALLSQLLMYVQLRSPVFRNPLARRMISNALIVAKCAVFFCLACFYTIMFAVCASGASERAAAFKQARLQARLQAALDALVQATRASDSPDGSVAVAAAHAKLVVATAHMRPRLIAGGEHCAICFDTMDNSGPPLCLLMLCGHAWHERCITAWLDTGVAEERDALCPMCNSRTMVGRLRLPFFRASAI